MKAIQLTQGKYALVDDEDFERVNQFKWCANRMGNVWYAVRRGCGNLGRMHRFIVDALKDSDVDHRDGDGLNNQKSKNL